MGVTEIVGVYDADAGLLGEAAYVWGKLRGTRHCGLCDITHGTVRRKGEWDRMAARLPVRVRLLHLNELDDELRDAVASSGAPVVLTREGDRWRVLLGASELDGMTGSVAAFDAAVRARLEGEST
ncbi:hypothetical protein GCM10011376_28280 [Nocardioides flavus (ex Wang et al. 2016)]|uniref:Uncharacterized protein n=1 Tax=Nocardioides flavus (ex Wang et al. 2016) TaxID=2058780 RepID=A0ABQ3HKK8_9ACTN|nr:hypothetical protein [Nocardioides flavus (ex Wang et al. 2016)]GHE18218.1 hypothetical protein GCM10011376_28280 [Nocardioides flavus (ex Wang et al. 2016)]